MSESADLRKEVADKERANTTLVQKLEELEQRFQDSKNQLREAEQQCNKLYSSMTNASTSHMTKLQESQQKFEEASLMITKQSAMIDDLNTQMEKLKDVNG